METIVSIAVSPIAKKVFDVVTSLMAKKFHSVQRVEEDILKLSSQLSAIRAVLQHAEAKQLNTPQIRDWLGKLREVLFDTEDLLESYETEALLWQRQQRKKKFPLPFCASQFFLELIASQEIKKVLERLEEIGREKQNLQLDSESSSSPASSEDRHTGFIVTQSDVVGRDDDKIRLLNLLLSEESDRQGDVSVLPIIGMGGLGKTTLAQLVYNDEQLKSHFEFRMWVCVTDVFNYTKILKDIIECHTEIKYDLSSLSIAQLESRFIDFLKGKSFLLVLDDVWPESFKWNKLKKLIQQGGKGCRVLVTSRSGNVSNIMGTLPPFFLDQLAEDKCQTLFEKLAFGPGGTKRSELKMEIGKNIVRKCEGLPLAIQVMGTLLRGIDDERRWRNILKHEIWEAEKHSDARPEILPALRLSYDHLPAHLKSCFAHCCIYPKAYGFHKMDLIKVWKAASFILPRGQYSLDDIGNEYFDELLNRSFFRLSKVDDQEIYRIHDLHYDLALSVSVPYCYQIKDNDPCNFDEKARHISLLSSAVQQPMTRIMERSQKLRTLLSPSDHLKNFGQALDGIFRTLKYIRILDLSSSVMLELPESVGGLKLLHYLDVSKTEIRRLPDSVDNLINLETLRLLECPWFSELPKGLGKLTNLQHLELDDMFWYKLRVLPQRIGSITGLQNLHAFSVSHEAGKGIDELKDLLHLKGALHIKQLENAANARKANLKDKEDLVKVVFEWSKRDGCQADAAVDENILEDLQPNPDVKEIQIVHYQGTHFPSWMRDGQVKNIVSVNLNHCINCRVLSLGQLSHLQNLSLKGNLELEEWIDAPYHCLCRLKISNCPKLRDMPKSFPKLSVMKIKKCNELKALPLIPSVQFLILIDNLILEYFYKFICISRSFKNYVKPVHVYWPCFINLFEMKVINCPKLPSLPKISAPQKLEVSACPRVTTLPTPESSSRFKHLAIDDCVDATLVRAIPSTSSLYSLVISKISNVTSFPKWPHLPVLKTLYISECNELTTLSSDGEAASVPFEGMTSLELLSIRGCPNLVRFPDKGLPATLKCLIISSNSRLVSLGPEDIFKSLTSLTDVYIENCPELHSLPEEGFSASLKHLRIEGCPELVKRCQSGTGEDWSKIQHIPDLEILEHAEIPDPSPPWYHCFICCAADGRSRENRKDEEFLDHKKKKRWVDEKSGNYCFMLYPRSLYVCWAQREYWDWKCFKETSDDNIEVLRLSHVCWLDVRGKFKVSDLSPGAIYEVVYVVKLAKAAFGWEFPINLRLSLPDGEVQERKVSLLEKPRGRWIELNVGSFQARDGEQGEVCFDLFENVGGRWKHGILVQGAIIRALN